jgi:hydroxyacid-oxoacid transhydrogenase
MPRDTVFQMTGSTVRFGHGATREVGADLVDLGCRRVLVIVDPAVVDGYPGETAIASLREASLEFDLFTGVRSEPTDGSFREAIDVASTGRYDGFLAIGGGSTIDTAKAANLYSTWPAEFAEYVNPTLGRGRTPPGPLKPLVAVPTTAGTGSETTAVAVFDFEKERVKTGIANRYLRPTLGILDPQNTRTCPKAVAAGAGLDVLSHALESFTARHYLLRERPERPSLRSAYQGANPISDVWALEALRILAECLPRVYADAGDDEARGRMLLAASYAGIGFGNAGVHLPHAMAYPVAGQVTSYHPPGYPSPHAMVPPRHVSDRAHTGRLPVDGSRGGRAAPHGRGGPRSRHSRRATRARRRRACRPRPALHAPDRSADGHRRLWLFRGRHPDARGRHDGPGALAHVVTDRAHARCAGRALPSVAQAGVTNDQSRFRLRVAIENGSAVWHLPSELLVRAPASA